MIIPEAFIIGEKFINKENFRDENFFMARFENFNSCFTQKNTIFGYKVKNPKDYE